MNMVVVGSVLILLLLTAMGAALIISEQKARKKRAMAVITGRSGDSKSKGRNDQDRRRAEIAKKLKEHEGDGSKKSKLKASLEQAGMDQVSVQKFWLFSALFSLAVMLTTKLLGMSSFVVLMLGVTALLGIPRLFVRHKRLRRQKKFLEEFSDALEAMVRLLKAGMPVSEAIKMAGREFGGPVGEEMSRIYDAQKIGIPLPEAALEATRRMPLTEMQMFATGVAIQQQTGASLSEVLLNLAGVIRARFRLQRKVKALSSEAKASAGIIGALPFLIGSGLYFINPEYIGLLFTTNMGRFLLAGGVVWMSIGIFIMKAMINFKV